MPNVLSPSIPTRTSRAAALILAAGLTAGVGAASAQAQAGLAARTGEGVVVAITTEITPELRDRGIARELVRAIGELRKKAGCKVSEQVRIGYVTSDAIVAAALSQHRAFVEGETLSQLAAQALPQPHGQSTVDLDDSQIELTLIRG